VVVALLHALWDASAAIAVWLTLLLTNTPAQWLIIEAGHAPRVSPAQVHIYTILNWVLLGLVGLFGLLIFIRHWRRSGTRTEAGTTRNDTPTSATTLLAGRAAPRVCDQGLAPQPKRSVSGN
jgi:hypothetical protein